MIPVRFLTSRVRPCLHHRFVWPSADVQAGIRDQILGSHFWENRVSKRYMMQFGVLLIWTLALTPAVAHHSVSGQWLATDDKLFTVTGILKSVEWTNPHV